MAHERFAPLSRGWMGGPSRGAAVGQPDRHVDAPTPRFYLRRVRLNSGGYDDFGSYWGCGAPLYQAES